MNNLKRVLACGMLFGIQALYLPLNRLLQGGLEFRTPLDDYVPLWPIWVVPYVLVWGWWVGSYVWATWQMEASLYEAFVIASAVVGILGLTTFAFFPTYVMRPVLTSSDWQTQLLSWVYTNDQAYNAFPSGHVYITTLIALFWSRWFPQWRWVWVGTVVVIAFATLFTGQHYLPDPLGGLALAWGGYRVGLWWVATRKLRFQVALQGAELNGR